MSERKYSLDVLRIAATILIVFHHYQQITGAYFEGRINFWNGRFYFGYVVEFFFLLSGLFMYRYMEKIDGGLGFKDFYLPRAVRLLPLVFISGITYEVFLAIYKSVCSGDWFGVSVTFWGVIINALGIQDGWVFPNPMVNNPTWYISVLLLCYLVFFMVTYWAKRWNVPRVYFYVFLILLGCGAQTYSINIPFLNASSSRGYYAFFFGLLFAGAMNKLERQNSLSLYGQLYDSDIYNVADDTALGVGCRRNKLYNDVFVLSCLDNHIQCETVCKAF